MSSRRPSSSRLFPLLTLPLAVILFAFAWFKYASRPVDSQATTRVNFSINRGQGMDSIARNLKDKNLIRSIPAFKLEVMLSNKAQKIQAGDFALLPSMNLATLVDALTRGTTDRWVTFLEGWRREEYAQAIIANFSENNPDLAFDEAEFLQLTKDLEGQLYPDTYSFPKTVTATVVVDRLKARFDEQTKDLVNNSGLTNYQALILASLLEREAVTDAERPIVAGILLKRLRNDWPLQVDATIQFIKANQTCKTITCNWWPKDITRADLDLPSPYNTYLHPGLPPAPISSPSLASIRAAYDPTTSEYWFYLHDSEGQIRYAKTIEEHNQNVARYLSK